MPDSISREELMREVADRLDADPGLVARRVAGGGARARRRRGRATRSRRPTAPPDGAQPPRALSSRERRELALLAMCVAAAGRGRGTCWSG